MNWPDIRRLAGRYGVVIFLAVISIAAVWYINVEDTKVGDEYRRLFHQNPNLIPADLTSLASLHISTASLLAQMSVTIGLALALSRVPRRHDDRPEDLVYAVRALTEAVNALTKHALPPLERVTDKVDIDAESEASALAVDLAEKSPSRVEHSQSAGTCHADSNIHP